MDARTGDLYTEDELTDMSFFQPDRFYELKDHTVKIEGTKENVETVSAKVKAQSELEKLRQKEVRKRGRT
jgi:hypothetical protein